MPDSDDASFRLGLHTCCHGRHNHGGSRGHHCGHRHGVDVGGGARTGWENHCLLVSGGGQDGRGAQLGHGGIVVRLGQDVGYKVGAG